MSWSDPCNICGNHRADCECTSYDKRKQWFLDRIGKRVFRETNGCSCEVCQRNTENGIVILDENHALYMLDCEAISQIPEESNHPFKYRDEI